MYYCEYLLLVLQTVTEYVAVTEIRSSIFKLVYIKPVGLCSDHASFLFIKTELSKIS